MNLAEEVMGLDQVCLQTYDQVIFKGILERLNLGWMNEQDEAWLRVLTLNDDHYTSKEIKDISEGALHLFTRHQAKMHTKNKNYARQLQRPILWRSFGA
jgi:hypothetical protein